MLCCGNLLLVSCINEGLETSFSLLPPGVEVGIAKEITRLFISYLTVHPLTFSHFLLSIHKSLYWRTWLSDCLCPTPMKFARVVRVGVLVLNFLLLMCALSSACCLWRQRDIQSGNKRPLSYSWCVPALGNLLGLLKYLLCGLSMLSSLLVCISFHFSCDNILLLGLILKNVLPFRTQLRLRLRELRNCKRCWKSNKHTEWPQTSVKNYQGRSSSVFSENGIVINFVLMVRFVCSQLQQAWIWEESSELFWNSLVFEDSFSLCSHHFYRSRGTIPNYCQAF